MLKITVANKWETQTVSHAAGPLEFGRGPGREAKRVVIANDWFVSRDQMRVEGIGEGKLRVENLSSRNPLLLEGGATVDPGHHIELAVPIRITVGETTIVIVVDGGGESLRNTEQISFAPIGSAGFPAKIDPLWSLGDAPSAVVLATWFETLLSVQQAAVGSDEFYDATARAVVNLIGLDRGIVLLLHDADWRIVASHSGPGCHAEAYSRTILRQVCEQRRTLCQAPDPSSLAASLSTVEAVVASPLFGPGGKLLGAIYGSRDVRVTSCNRKIQPLEAQVVQLLAAIVSTGLIRLQREMEAAEARVRFEQFCSPELAGELQRNPSLLEGSEREITVLFTDLRGFSALSERLTPIPLYRLMGDLMDRLTNCVIHHGGVIVDYYGDGLCAMWDAPADQADHADRACEAALDMLSEMPALNVRWAQQLEKPLQIGIGINTGPAQVGNMGSKRRLKYGPRGHTVNLASRVEGSTKHFGVPAFVTAATRDRLRRPFALRRTGRVRVVGVAGAVELFELFAGAADEVWRSRRDAYEQALELVERGMLAQALVILDGLVAGPESATDAPAMLLRRRVSTCVANPSDSFDPVLTLDVK
jgi:adenylate cyclase